MEHLSSPDPKGHNTLSTIVALGSNDVWEISNGWSDLAVGVPVAVPEHLHWNGTTWTSVAPPPNVGTSDNIRVAAVASSGTVWVVGVAGGAGPLILRGP